MGDDSRIYIVRSLLSDFVKSPSLRHIRDHTVNRLAQDIIKSLDRSILLRRRLHLQAESRFCIGSALFPYSLTCKRGSQPQAPAQAQAAQVISNSRWRELPGARFANAAVN